MFYLIHGLIFQSEFSLSLPEVQNPQKIDVTVKNTTINSTEFDHDPNFSEDVYYKIIDTQNIFLSIPKIAKFHIKNGKNISIDAYGQLAKNWSAIELYLFGSIIGVILVQRDLFALHSNAILINNKGVLIAGDSGAGKSTTAAIFQQKGYKVLCDDIVVINNDLCINGEFPKIKLWDDALKKLNINESGLTPVATQLGKFHYPLTQNNKFSASQFEISAIYILSTSDSITEIKTENIKGFNRYGMLLSNTYRNELVLGLNKQEKHLDLCSLLAEKVSITAIQRPKNIFSGFDIVNKIIHDIEAKT